MRIATLKNKIKAFEKSLDIGVDINLPKELKSDPIAAIGFIMKEMRNGKGLTTRNGDLLVHMLDAIGMKEGNYR